MTTSYKIEAIKELRAKKKLDREAEAQSLSEQRATDAKAHADNLARIAKKQDQIASGNADQQVEDEPKPKPKPKATSKKTTTKKATSKKRGRPKKS